jgi:hypothetical protein
MVSGSTFLPINRRRKGLGLFWKMWAFTFVTFPPRKHLHGEISQKTLARHSRTSSIYLWGKTRGRAIFGTALTSGGMKYSIPDGPGGFISSGS